MVIELRDAVANGYELISIKRAAQEKNYSKERLELKIKDGEIDLVIIEDGFVKYKLVPVNLKYIMHRKDKIRVDEIWKKLQSIRKKKTPERSGLSRGRATPPSTKNSLSGLKASTQDLKTKQDTSPSSDTKPKLNDGQKTSSLETKAEKNLLESPSESASE